MLERHDSRAEPVTAIALISAASVLPKYQTCIFVNGCFWHGHKGCRYYTVPKTNVDFWKDKVKRNIERDTMNIQNLELLSWSVITIWECELKHKRLSETMVRVMSELSNNQLKLEEYRERRRSNRTFVMEQTRRHRELIARLESELDTHIPERIRRMSKEEQ